jgi:hypothetical protein
MPSYTDYQSMSATAIGQQQITDIKKGKKDGGIKVVAAKSKVTSQRLPATFTDQFIENPGLARSNLAASVDKPDGDQGWRDKVKEYVCIFILFPLPSL